MTGKRKADFWSLSMNRRSGRRLLKKLNSRCRHCSGYEEKIHPKDQSPLHQEIAEMEKHELISRISTYLGHEPEALSTAEDLFDNLKYCITEYVLKHEFNGEAGLSVQVALWLEHRRQPNLIEPLEDIISKYLKPSGTDSHL